MGRVNPNSHRNRPVQSKSRDHNLKKIEISKAGVVASSCWASPSGPSTTRRTDAQSSSRSLSPTRRHRTSPFKLTCSWTMGAVIQKNRPTPPLAMASDRSLSSASPSSRAPHESPCLAMAGAGSSTTIQRLLPIRSARPRERFSDLLTMIDGKSMATLI